MSIKRFRSLSAAYGADLRRWPEEERRDAQLLLEASAEARAVLAEASDLDRIVAHAAEQDRAARDAEEQAVALTRLRSHVALRIGQPTQPRIPGALRFVAALLVLARARRQGFGVMGFASLGALSIAAGLIIGWAYTPPPNSHDPILLLETAPLRILISEHE